MASDGRRSAPSSRIPTNSAVPAAVENKRLMPGGSVRLTAKNNEQVPREKRMTAGVKATVIKSAVSRRRVLIGGVGAGMFALSGGSASAAGEWPSRVVK